MSQLSLTAFANTLIDDIRSKLISTGANATGKTAASLSFLASENRLIVSGGKSFGLNKRDSNPFVEGGRGVGGMPPYQAIKDWVIARGIPMSAIYPIRKKIAERGTNLWIDNDRRDIVGSLLTDERINSLLENINREALDVVKFEIFETLIKRRA